MVISRNPTWNIRRLFRNNEWLWVTLPKKIIRSETMIFRDTDVTKIHITPHIKFCIMEVT